MQVDGKELSATELRWVNEFIRLQRRQVEQAKNEHFDRAASLLNERYALRLPDVLQAFRDTAIPGDSPVTPHLCMGIHKTGKNRGQACSHRPKRGCHGYCEKHVTQHPYWDATEDCVKIPPPAVQLQAVQPRALDDLADDDEADRLINKRVMNIKKTSA